MKMFAWKRFIMPEDQADNILWKRIDQNFEVDQAEIETLYEDQKASRAPAGGGGADAGVVVPQGKVKKGVFSADENKVLLLGIPQCPKPPIFLEAIVNWAESGSKVSNEQLGTLLRVWPKETDIKTLIQDPPGEDEEWEKGEAFMVQLAELNSVYPRLKVACFKTQWEEEREIP